MKTETSQTDLLRRYLLDDLTEDEYTAVEERFLTDDAAFDEMLALEDELFYEYHQNELDAREHDVFERKFLRSREDRDKAAFAGAFLEAAADIQRERNFAAVPVVEERPSFLQSIAAFFNFRGSAMQFGMAAAALLLFLGVIGLLFQNARIRNEMASIQQQNDAERREREARLAQKQKERQEIENELAAEREKSGSSEERIRELESERNKLETEIRDRRRQIDQPAGSPESVRQPTLATLVISPGLFNRSDGQPMNRVVIATAVRTLNLRLTLKNVDEYEKFGVNVATVDDDVTILAKSNLKAAGKGAKRSITLNIPNKALRRADYQVTLTGTTKTGETEDITKYYFSVDKQ